MNFGGPVWHVSIASRVAPPEVLAEEAERQLAGVGDASLGEWREWTGTAFHLRRRLAAHEEARVGPALDIRGTPEHRRRLERVYRWLPGWVE